MKKSILLICILFVSSLVISQTIVYHENFELNSLADSVSMDSVGFAVNQWAISTTLASQGLRSDSCSVSLSDTTFLTTDAFSTLGNSNVMLSFSHICKIEFFDAAEIFVSNNNGSTWTKLTGTHYLGTGQFGGQGNKFASTSYSSWLPNTNNAIPTNSWWKVEQFDISSIAANSSQVKVRFSLRDGTNNGPMLNYGWLIDDIEVLASFSELIPPTISLNQPVLIDSVYHTGPYDIYATITDVSGIDTAMLIYNYNNGTPDTIGMTNSSANIFFARIDTLNGPFNLSDTFCYSIYAIDASAGQNVATEPAIGCNQFVIYTSPPPSGCSTPITNFPYFEDFETATLGSGSPSNPGNLPSGWTRNPSTGSVYMMLVHSGTTGSG
ncbi:MAG: hypothetical protein K9J13_04815, partial [Saprospiraceae bacterium]|nr:hypothetical protein [Saprospiraceae bacterium]